MTKKKNMRTKYRRKKHRKKNFFKCIIEAAVRITYGTATDNN